MELWLRRREGLFVDWEERLTIASLHEWREAIKDPTLVSSILWPKPPLFVPAGRHYLSRHHPHEVEYTNKTERNQSYLEGCRRLAARLRRELSGAKVLVYAPMRGAYPIWQVTSQFLSDLSWHTYYPVTSSFLKYPPGIVNHKGKPAGGRFTNYLELSRLRPFLSGVEVLLYVDEIISGGMMRGHVKEMLELGIDRQVRVVVAGLADSFGARSASNRERIEALLGEGRLYSFLWEGCAESITEDQKFLLGVHYTDYNLGPHVVPVLDDSLDFYPERRQFFSEVIVPPPLPTIKPT